MTVYLQDPDVTLYHGDALETLRGLPDESVHCVVTSPPYWGLRDYGTGAWAGGDPDCDHLPPPIEPKVYDNGQGQAYTSNNQNWNKKGRQYQGDVCGKCGAHRTDNQMGLEPTPELYVQNMVQVFREVRRVLRRDGTCWLNIADSYNSAASNQRNDLIGGWDAGMGRSTTLAPGLKPKDLIGIPWRLAFALQQDGWWLRADIIWAKPNPMPESVTDRPTKAHEYVFLLTRSPRYYFDAEAVREDGPTYTRKAGGYHGRNGQNASRLGGKGGFGDSDVTTTGRNVRSVWEIATEPFPQAHFATFPTELARRCILAGTSERGCCPECGAPWERELERTKEGVKVTVDGGKAGSVVSDGLDRFSRPLPRARTGEEFTWHVETVGWRPSCDCEGPLCPDCGFTHRDDVHQPAPIPCTVLDPFAGACTVPLVARRHGRHSIGIELSETYLREIALPRLQQLSLLA